jgi:hypothetical protein
MPTTQEEKPAKSRARNRKADQRSSKGRQQQVEVRAAEPDPVSPMVAEPEVAEAEMAAVDIAPAVAAVDVAPEVAEVDVAPVVAMETVIEPALSGEVLPPEVRSTASQAAPLQAIAQAYDEYTQKSWLNGRLLVERLIAVRSFDEAIEIQGEFAKQAYTNFLVQSERICVLYGEWAQQFFRPLEKLATEWPRIGR